MSEGRLLQGSHMRIATVYQPRRFYPFTIRGRKFSRHSMDNIVWVRLSQAIAALGFDVDLVTDARRDLPLGPSGFRCVAFPRAGWSGYDAAFTFVPAGYQTLAQELDPSQLPVLSILGSVVGRTDDTSGVYFFGEPRRRLYEIQQQVQANSKVVIIQTEANKELWEREFGSGDKVLLIPGAVDRSIPPPAKNPFDGFKEKIAIYIGHIYRKEQKEVNLDWQRRLNRLGALLKKKDVRLCFLGSGDLDELDGRVVTVLGKVPNEQMWDYQYFADVGIVLAQGRVQRNESTKIYYYLRTGLPVVSEAPVPNNDVIREAGAGLIAEYGDETMLADMIQEAAHRRWDHDSAIRYILDHHTYEHRAALYQRAILSLGR